jgi:3-phosphoshikimate 1-carboxyvinyltransferase
VSAIVISPGPGDFETRLRPPGSKSHTIRALFAAASSTGESRLRDPLDSQDTKHARDCLSGIGAVIDDTREDEWVVVGTGGRFTPPDRSLDAGESGLTTRLLLGVAPLVPGPMEIIGRGRLPLRPMTDLLDYLRDRGVAVSAEYPWRIDPERVTPVRSVSFDDPASSQAVSAVLFASAMEPEGVRIEVANLRSSSAYVEMTVGVMRHFGGSVDLAADGSMWVAPTGYAGTSYAIPCDASSSVYPAAAAAVTGGRAEISGDLGDHPDVMFFDVLEEMGCSVERGSGMTVVYGPERLRGVDVDMSHAPDAAVCLAVVAAVADGTTRIAGLESLRLKESDRLSALEGELSRLGIGARAGPDHLVIDPGPIHAGTLASHNDHRIAMSLAILGLVAPGVVIEDPQVVGKTWPNYWEWLESTGATTERI